MNLGVAYSHLPAGTSSFVHPHYSHLSPVPGRDRLSPVLLPPIANMGLQFRQGLALWAVSPVLGQEHAASQAT